MLNWPHQKDIKNIEPLQVSARTVSHWRSMAACQFTRSLTQHLKKRNMAVPHPQNRMGLSRQTILVFTYVLADYRVYIPSEPSQLDVMDGKFAVVGRDRAERPRKEAD